MALNIEQNTAAQIAALAYDLAKIVTKRQLELDPNAVWEESIHENARRLLPEVVSTYYEAASHLRGEFETPTADFITP